ncbi:hypothetical protein BT69DRAFT_1232763 [Atractiella rhizophila]|nr:hypothetical protein BT69DRAFT_1232763 [Atractiella rhizophila]
MGEKNSDLLLLLLSDSNLPTGGFISSAGLESFTHHGMLSPSSSSAPSSAGSGKTLEERTVLFWENAVVAYANQGLWFLIEAHRTLEGMNSKRGERALVLERILELDRRYDTILMNDVTRRTRAQGLAHLVLFEKCFVVPETKMDGEKVQVLKEFKNAARRGECHAHQPIAFGILCAALGISSKRTQYLHLFLYSRSILSAAVRLNLIGPYASQRILVTRGDDVITRALSSTEKLSSLASSSSQRSDAAPTKAEVMLNGLKNSATTNPLMEILSGRHDVVHSRMFNS